MSAAVPVAFYAPLKSPDHPLPSGDRTMARLFMRALQEAGFAPELASRLRSYDGAGDFARQRLIRDDAIAEGDRIAEAFSARPADKRPRLWFTYHCYYKAPDWIGPRVADRLGMPYVVAEASRAGKRADGPWALHHAGAEAALDRADLVLAMTDIDAQALRRAGPPHQRVVDCPPFIDLAGWNLSAPRAVHERNPQGPIRLLCVAMMRPGDKLASYRLLAGALERTDGGDWTLDIVGDGPAEPEVRGLFARFGARVAFHGRVEDRARLAAFYADADLFVWPAVNEAYGMVLLEAQAFGVPVVAGRCGGVASVVRDGETGLLTIPGDPDAFAAALSDLIADPARRRRMGEAARAFVADERALPQAARLLRGALEPLLVKEAAG